MTGIIAGILQIIVPSYAFRLVRRFGSERVGWFVVAAFVMLSLIHAVAPINVTGANQTIPVEWILMAGSVLLLLGMGHLDTRLGEHEQVRFKEEGMRHEWKLEFERATAELVKENRALTDQISSLLQREAALTWTAAQFQAFFDSLPVPVWVFDLRSMHLIAANQASLRLYGLTAEQMLALSAPELCCPNLQDAFQEDCAKPCRVAEGRGRWKHCRGDGSEVEVELTALDLRLDGFSARLMQVIEVKVREQHEAGIRQAERFEVVRQLSAVAASRFSSVLESIEQNVPQISSRLQDPNLIESLKLISKAVAKGQTARRQLLCMAGQLPLQVEVIEINDFLRNMHRPLMRLVGDRIKIEILPGACMSPALADARAIESIILQLINNAREAMPNGGLITLSAATVNVNSDRSDQFPAAKQFIRLSVRDSGRGIPQDLQSRIFDPAFVEGAGKPGSLGLATVNALVRQHSGWIELESQVGSGAEFRLFLPCAPVSAIQRERETLKTRKMDRETIMLVDADDRTRGMARFVLNREGYRLVEADSTLLALTLWESQGSKIDLLLTELEFTSGISGLELAAELQSRKPGLRTVFLGEAAAQSGSPEGSRFLCKPYTPTKLIEEVESALPESV